MFSSKQKQLIAQKVEELLLSLNHPEMPETRPEFKLHVDGKEDWSYADIEPNWKFEGRPISINPFNEEMAKTMYSCVTIDNKKIPIDDAVADALMEQATKLTKKDQQLADKVAEIERLRKFITDAHCPYCDGSGAIRIEPDEWEQCRWCYERQAALDAAAKDTNP